MRLGLADAGDQREAGSAHRARVRQSPSSSPRDGLPGATSNAVASGSRKRRRRVALRGQEARRRGHVGIRPRGAGQVEELASALVANDARLRAYAVQHARAAARARRGLSVGRGRRPERRQVAEEQRLERVILGEAPARASALPA